MEKVNWREKGDRFPNENQNFSKNKRRHKRNVQRNHKPEPMDWRSFNEHSDLQLTSNSIKYFANSPINHRRLSRSSRKSQKVASPDSSPSLSGSSEEDDHLETLELDNATNPEWKQALAKAIKEKLSQRVEVPEYVLRAICAKSLPLFP